MFKISACFCLILYLIRLDLTVAALCEDATDPGNAEKIRLKVYKGNSSHFTYVESSPLNPEVIASAIQPNQETIVYAHGFVESPQMPNVQGLIRAFLDRKNVNVIVVDWSAVSVDINYIYVSSQVPGVGRAVGKALQNLSSVIDFNKLNVIGHSLGAHVASYIGRALNGNLYRVTGLDPALPLFYPSECHIKPTDARDVVILHTDNGFYGTPVDTGTVDFYANLGTSPQPGCPVIIGAEYCSHQRSVWLYIESVNNPKAFLSHKCPTLNITEKNDGPEEVYFGESTPANLHGRYCFATNGFPPYSKSF